MTPANPLPIELSAQLAALSPTQLAWLSGYCWAQSQGAAGGLQKRRRRSRIEQRGGLQKQNPAR